jgi:hypothetical protein
VLVQAGIIFPTQDRLCTVFSVQEARRAARGGGGGGGGGGGDGPGANAPAGGRGGHGGGRGRHLVPAWGRSSFGGRGSGALQQGQGQYHPHVDATWQALAVVAAVSDAFDAMGPGRAWDVLRAEEAGGGGSGGSGGGSRAPGVALLKQHKAEQWMGLKQQLQVRACECGSVGWRACA